MTKLVVHCVLGPISAGKTTFVNNQFCVGDHEDDKRTVAVIVRVGKMLRESVGISCMMQDKNPLACDVTEFWVRHHVIGALHTALDLGRPVVFDAQPRSLIQVGWFAIELQKLKSKTPGLEIDTHVWDLRTRYDRPDRTAEETRFDNLRRVQSEQDHDKVLDALFKAIPLIGKVTQHVIGIDSLQSPAGV